MYGGYGVWAWRRVSDAANLFMIPDRKGSLHERGVGRRADTLSTSEEWDDAPGANEEWDDAPANGECS